MIHPLAYIHPDARLADNVKVDPFTVIHGNVSIGEGTWIGSNVTIMEGARIGKNCRIFPGAVIAAIPQDLKFQGENSQVVIGDNTTIREFVTVNRGTKHSDKTVIGSNCLIQAYCHLAHDCVVGDFVTFGPGVMCNGNVHIEDHAYIGADAVIKQGLPGAPLVIGRGAVVGMGAVVTKSVPPGVTVVGNPARPLVNN